MGSPKVPNDPIVLSKVFSKFFCGGRGNVYITSKNKYPVYVIIINIIRNIMSSLISHSTNFYEIVSWIYNICESAYLVAEQTLVPWMHTIFSAQGTFQNSCIYVNFPLNIPASIIYFWAWNLFPLKIGCNLTSVKMFGNLLSGNNHVFFTSKMMTKQFDEIRLMVLFFFSGGRQFCFLRFLKTQKFSNNYLVFHVIWM